jgi:amidase
MFRAAGELAGLVRSGQLTARELVSASLARIDELEPQINAFTHVAYDSALAAAEQIHPGDPRPFAGVPIAVKDNRPVKGMPLTMCSDLYGDFIPDHDAFLVRRLRDAGFVIVGKTALPEMGILPTTESRRFGPTRNPWALDRTPGGSSGGAAAAVAAGMVPLAHGNDGGGSTRIPAACCGLVGLKGARGRVSQGPDTGQSFFTVDGVLTRTVAETAQLIDLLQGYERGDANWAPPPPGSYAELVRREPGRMRIGLAFNSPLEGVALDPVSERAVRDAGRLFESLGHGVDEIAPPWSGLDLMPDFMRTFGPAVSTATMIGGRLAGREPTEEDVEPLTWAMWERSRKEDTMSYLSAMARLESVSRSLIAYLEPFDAVLMPVLAQRPVLIGMISGDQADPWASQRRAGHFTPYTAIVNVTGLPAISLPLYHGDDGLPTAVQLVGPPAREEVLLMLSTQLEQALPWVDRRPSLAAAVVSGS